MRGMFSFSTQPFDVSWIWRLEGLIVTVCTDWPSPDIPDTPEYLASTSLYHLPTVYLERILLQISSEVVD